MKTEHPLEQADLNGRQQMFEKRFMELKPAIQELYKVSKQIQPGVNDGKAAYDLLNRSNIEFRSANQQANMMALRKKFSQPLDELVLKRTVIHDGEVSLQNL